MQPTRLPRKKDVALALLEQASVFVHVDPRLAEVRVPPWFKRQPQLVLQIGLNMPVPIPDLDVSDHGLSCTLSFNRSPFLCQIPWGSVFALVGESGRGMVWPDDVPPEVAAQAQKQAKPKLASVPDAPQKEESAPVAEKAPARKKSKKAPAVAAARSNQPATKAAPAKAKAAPAKATPAKTTAAKPAPAKTTPAKVAASKAAAAKKPGRGKTAARARPEAAPQPERARPRAAPAPAPALARKAESATAAGAAERGSAADRNKKRALPPYLRVVK